jgi:hypothetical protein
MKMKMVVKYGDIDGKDLNMHMDVIKHEPNQKVHANFPLGTILRNYMNNKTNQILLLIF